MKNFTKFLMTLVIIAISSVVVFVPIKTTCGQGMTLEQKVAFDKQNTPTNLPPVIEVPGPKNTDGGNRSTTILSEAFTTGIPSGWTQTIYGGIGTWEWCNGCYVYGGGPPNSDGKFMVANSDAHNGWSFNVGIFTPSMNFGGGFSSVTIEYDRNFQDLVGSDLAYVAIYSGGKLPANRVQYLWYDLGVDNIAHAIHTIDPAILPNPSDVYLEFYYYTGGTWQWSFSVDNVLVSGAAPEGNIEGYVFNYDGLSINGAKVEAVGAGVFTYTDPAGHYFIGPISGGNQEFSVSKEGYNTSSAFITIPGGETIQYNWTLTQPVMIVNPLFISETLNPNEYFTTSMNILDNGSGPLAWAATIVYPESSSQKPVNNYDLKQYLASIEQPTKSTPVGKVYG